MTEAPGGPYWEFSFDARATQLNWSWRKIGASGGIEIEGGRFGDFGRAITDAVARGFAPQRDAWILSGTKSDARFIPAEPQASGSGTG